jgi:hypothetical protein
MAMEKKIKKITGSASSSAAGKPAKITSRNSFYNTKSYAPTNAAASSVNTSVKMSSSRAVTPAAVGRMSALDRSIATGVSMKSRNKNPGKFVR